MLRSMYSGVSGLRAHQTKLDVIGNNISNVNTTGFKSSRVTFKEMLSQTIQGASSPQDGIGGVNPQQVGLGVDIGSIDVNHSQGNRQSTGINTDLALEGNGYFVLNDGQQNYYTRAGAFDIDSSGNLVNTTNGYNVRGWRAEDGDINTNNSIENLKIQMGKEIPAEVTEKVVFSGNLDSRAEDEDTRTASIDVFDSLGDSHTISLEFVKDSDNTWNWSVSNVSNASSINGEGTIEFNENGDIDSGTDGTIEFDPDGGADTGQQITISFDDEMGSVSQRAGSYTIDGLYADGYESGDLDSFSIDSTGIINGKFSNGINLNLGQIAIANFSNPNGLNKIGDTMFSSSQNSGIPQIGPAGNGGRGEIYGGYLEMSNVDLAEQFTEMITAQRGFQSNSKAITTSDEMLQELVNLKR